jgi:prolipoprotein diacylglyceryltransferase
MSNEIIFVSALAVILLLLLRWGFRTLPGEEWQIMASLPVSKSTSGEWRGINLTYYGLLTANAYVIAVAVFLVLMGAIHVQLEGAAIMTLSILLICVPASRIVAIIVEKKRHTFTVGGASFVGIIMAPAAILLINRTLNSNIPLIPALSAIAISYSFGEGIGRLACISFGCCYGRPLAGAHPLLQMLFNRYSFIFLGKTKKIAYERGLDGVKVVPIQAITTVMYCSAGIAGTLLFMLSHFTLAFILTITVTQGWRALSEMLRADYRGEGKISSYQIMAIISIIYSGAISLLFNSRFSGTASVAAGFASWTAPITYSLMILWLTVFIHTGLSTVTGATITFHVHRDRI